MSGVVPRVLLLGWSSIGRRRIVPALARLGARADVASRTQDVALPDGVDGRAFHDYAEALRESTADIVYVSTRNHEHAAHASEALASGRHVIVDKPATLSVEDTARLIEQATAAGRLVAEATVWMWHPQIAAAADSIAAHGPIDRVAATFTYPALPADNFRHAAAYGGGALWDLGPYAVTAGRVFFGDAPDAIEAEASGGEPETDFRVVMRYQDGRTLTGTFSVAAPYANRIDLGGPRLSLAIERAFTTPADLATRITGDADGVPVVKDAPAGDTFAAFLADVIAAADSGNHAPWARAMLSDATVLARLRQAAGRTTSAIPDAHGQD